MSDVTPTTTTTPLTVFLQEATTNQHNAEKELSRLHDVKRETERNIEAQIARINHHRGAVAVLERALKTTQVD